MAHEKKCIVCGKEYKYCSHCSQYNSDETWRYLYCSENCRKIFHIFSDVKGKAISEEEARKRFKECDLSDIDSFSDELKAMIGGASKEEAKEELANLEVEVDDTAATEVEVSVPTEEVPAAEEEVETPTDVEEEVEAPVDAEEKTEKLFYNKKKHNK